MARHTHVLLVHDEPPTAPDALRIHVQRITRAGVAASVWLRWWHVLWTWWVTWRRTRKLIPMLEHPLAGVSPASAVHAQAASLQRVLGRRYTCHGVFSNGTPSVESACATVGRQDQVVVMPMDAVCDWREQPSAVEVIHQIRSATDQFVSAPPWSGEQAWQEAVAECLRTALLRRSTPSEPYSVVFVAVAGPHEASVQRARTAARGIAAAAQLARPWRLACIPELGSSDDLFGSALEDLTSAGEEIIVIYLSASCSTLPSVRRFSEHANRAARQRSVSLVEAPCPETRPTFVQALAERVRDAERSATWTVPEDRIRAEVQAMWASFDGGTPVGAGAEE